MIPVQALIAVVGNGPETLVQPHLWPEERLVWCERPTRLGAVLAQVSYAYKKANAAVELLDRKSTRLNSSH